MSRTKLLLYLAGKHDGVPLAELPQDLLDPDLLTVCDDDKLIEFGRQDLDSGRWEFVSLTGPKKKPFDVFLPEVLSGKEPELHVRLTSPGRVEASRLKIDITGSNPQTTEPEESFVWLNRTEGAKWVGISPKQFGKWLKGEEGSIQTFGERGSQYKFLRAELDAKKKTKSKQ